MTPEAVVTTLRRVRFTPALDRQGGYAIGLRTIAKAAGIDRMTIYKAARGERLARLTQKRLTEAVERLTSEGAFDGLPPLTSTDGHRCPTCGRLR